MERLSLDRRITDIIPPTFLWHTYEDICVPVGKYTDVCSWLEEGWSTV